MKHIYVQETQKHTQKTTANDVIYTWYSMKTFSICFFDTHHYFILETFHNLLDHILDMKTVQKQFDDSFSFCINIFILLCFLFIKKKNKTNHNTYFYMRVVYYHTSSVRFFRVKNLTWTKHSIYYHFNLFVLYFFGFLHTSLILYIISSEKNRSKNMKTPRERKKKQQFLF